MTEKFAAFFSGKDVKVVGNLLKVENLSKHYIVGNTWLSNNIIHAVRSISFEVHSNESLGLIGESGCGKSTVAKMLLKLIESSEGTIELFEKNITSFTEQEMKPFRKDIQIIFQYAKAVLDPKMTVEELLMEPLIIHHIVSKGNMNKEVDRLMNLVGLSRAEKSKFPTQLSGGQNQRIIIARAIATKPKLIICDEPVSALDVSVQGQILNLLSTLKNELNLTYLFISHDLKVIGHMCERIAVMYKGEIVETGGTNQILSNPQNVYTKSLIDAML